jgi:hypothetical protein
MAGNDGTGRVQAVDFRCENRGHKMLCPGLIGGLDLQAVSGSLCGIGDNHVSICRKSEKYCCDAANKEVDGGGVGA